MNGLVSAIYLHCILFCVCSLCSVSAFSHAMTLRNSGSNSGSRTLQKSVGGGRLLGKALVVNMANVLDGEPLELCEENAVLVIEEIRQELGTIFGYDPKSREVGITGEIDLVEVAGPEIVVSLSGRFWHATDTVMLRVESFIKNRIPEVMEVTLDMSNSDIKDDNRLNTDGGPKRLF